MWPTKCPVLPPMSEVQTNSDWPEHCLTIGQDVGYGLVYIAQILLRNRIRLFLLEHGLRVYAEPHGIEAHRLDQCNVARNAKESMARLRKLADCLRRDYPDAAASLLEGLEECFTINRLELPPTLHRCLATTNLIESSQSGVRLRTGRICRWRAKTSQRCVAAAFLETEKHCRHYGIQRTLRLEGYLARRNDEGKGKGENRVRWYPAVSCHHANI